MSMRPTEPGLRISTGHIRVDAKRAIAKLREHQLTDRITWILEAVRGAVAAGATSIEVDGDSNDIWLRWRGEPLPTDALATLLDELVSPEGRGAHDRRLLGTAINGALGLDPAYVDVIAIAASGEATRARYSPRLFELDADDTQLDLGIDIEAVESPPDAPWPGMVIHMRRAVGIDTLHYLFAGPPELKRVRQNCADLAIPITVAGEKLTSPHEILRRPIEGAKRAFASLLEPDQNEDNVGGFTLEVAERGVRLATYTVPLDGVGDFSRLPIRVFVDSDRMPTNASRSEVRRDAHPISTITRAAPQAITDLVAELCKSIDSNQNSLADNPFRQAAIAIMRCVASSPLWIAAPVNDTFSPLFDLPLVRNAIGEWRSVNSRWEAAVHRGRKPYAEELGRWLREIPWIPKDDPATALFGNRIPDARSAKRAAKAARAELKAERKFLAAAERRARLAESHSYCVRAALGARLPGSSVAAILEQSIDRGLDGEVCVHSGRGDGRTHILYKGREIEVIVKDSAIAYDAVCNSPHLIPVNAYRGVLRDAAFDEVEQAVTAQVVAAIEAQVSREIAAAGIDVQNRPADPRATAELLRRASAFAWVEGLEWSGRGPFDDHPVWPTADGNFTSTDELRKHAVIGTVEKPGAVAGVGDRPLVLVNAVEHWRLKSLLEPATHVVRYGVYFTAGDHSSLAKPRDRLGNALGPISSDFAVLACESGKLTGAIAVGDWVDPGIVVHHAGIRLKKLRPQTRIWPCQIWVDVPDAIPTDEWTDLSDFGAAKGFNFGQWEVSMARALATALIGEPSDRLRVGSVSLDTPLGKMFAEAMTKHSKPEEVLGLELFAKLCAHPLFLTLDSEPISADQLADEFKKRIPYVAYPGPNIPPGWPALVADQKLANFAAKLADREVYDGSAKLLDRKRRHRRDNNLEAHRRKQPTEMSLPKPSAEFNAGSGISGILGVGQGPPGITFRLYVERRLFCTGHLKSTLPLRAELEVPESLINDDFTDLPDASRRKLEVACGQAVGRLLLALGAADPEQFATPGPAHSLLGSWLHNVESKSKARICTELRSSLQWPTVQGGLASVREASSGLTRVSESVGDWLEGDTKHRLDAPILAVDTTEMRSLLQALAPVDLEDVSAEVQTLQLSRQMAAGHIARPAVNASATVKRTLEELGETRLGPGEIALSAEKMSRITIYHGGRRVADQPLITSPPVLVAIESPTLAAEVKATLGPPEDLISTLSSLGVRLLEEVIDSVDALPVWLEHMMVTGLLSGELVTNTISELAIFDTTAQTKCSYSDLCDQAAQFGSVWYTVANTDIVPLDHKRIAVALKPSQVPTELSDLIEFVNADRELELDKLARANRDRPRVTEIVLAPGERQAALGVNDLSSSQSGKPRAHGEVAALKQEAAGLRGLTIYRNGLFLGNHPDPCSWPTAAVVSDRSLTPDRTWSAPIDDGSYKRLIREVRAASESALNKMFPYPKSVLTTRRFAAQVGELEVRGRFWLEKSPDASGIHIDLATGSGVMSPTKTVGGSEVRLPIAGKVITYPSCETPPTAALGKLIGEQYEHLLKQARRRWKTANPDHVSAHVAYGLALGAIRSGDIGAVKFPCLDCSDRRSLVLSKLLRDGLPEDAVLTDDGSLTYKTIRALADRVVVPEPIVEVDIEASEPEMDVLEVEAPAVAPPQPLDALREAIAASLQRLVFPSQFAIFNADRSSPLITWNSGLRLAAESPRLLALDAALANRDPRAARALRAVVLHCVALLDEANQLTVTAAESALERIIQEMRAA